MIQFMSYVICSFFPLQFVFVSFYFFFYLIIPLSLSISSLTISLFSLSFSLSLYFSLTHFFQYVFHYNSNLFGFCSLINPPRFLSACVCVCLSLSLSLSLNCPHSQQTKLYSLVGMACFAYHHPSDGVELLKDDDVRVKHSDQTYRCY